MKKILTALVTLGIVVGVLTYYGDGLKPWDAGWLDRTQAKMKQVMSFGEDVATNKLPDPAGLDVPKLGPDGNKPNPLPPIQPQLPPDDKGFQVPDPNPQPLSDPHPGGQ